MGGERLKYVGVFVTMGGTVLRTVDSYRGQLAVVEWDNGAIQEMPVSSLDKYRQRGNTHVQRDHHEP